MSQAKKQLIILSGYARSGKSTFLEVAKDLDCGVVSTSEILHDFTNLLIRRLLGVRIDTKNKSDMTTLWFNIKQGVTSRTSIVSWLSRDILINIAENCLVPVFGRDVFGLAAAKKIIHSRHKTLVYEAFNKSECDSMLHFLSSLDGLDNYEVHVVTIVRDDAEPGVDGRELLRGIYDEQDAVKSDCLISNNWSLEDFEDEVEEYLSIVTR